MARFQEEEAVTNAEFQASLYRVCADKGWDITPFNESYKVAVKVREITKDLLVTFAEDPETSELWVRIWSEGCRAEILDPTFLLRLAGEDRFMTGSVALKRDRILICDSMLASETTEMGILSRLWSVARFALAIGRLADQALQGQGTGKFVRSKLLDDLKKVPEKSNEA